MARRNRVARAHLVELRVRHEIEVVACYRTRGNAFKQRIIGLENLDGENGVSAGVQVQAQNSAGVVYAVLNADQIATVFVEAVKASGCDLR